MRAPHPDTAPRWNDSSRGLTPRVGDRLGRYTLCAEIARGGMATVFLGRVEGRAGPDRFVAVKCITPSCADDANYVEMFHDEASLIARIKHANVCGFVDFGEASGIPYLVTELVAGRSLTAVVRTLSEQAPARWSIADENALMVRLLIDACEALHAVHELTDADGTSLGAVHRDVSPSNLLVGFDGHLRLIDFGVALASRQRHRTRAGVVKGKYSYLAPELIRGKRADRRADIWAVGVVAWELLTHRQLFDQDSELAVLEAIASNEEIPPPSAVRPGISKSLDDLIMGALQRSPRRRCDSARELGKSLHRYLIGAGVAVGAADVAEAMDELFPGGRARDRDVIERASLRHPRGRRGEPPPLPAVLRAAGQRSATTATRPVVSPAVLASRPSRVLRARRAGFATLSLVALSLGWATCRERAQVPATVVERPGPAGQLADANHRP